MTDIQRDYEQRWTASNSRWLAWCHAVGRDPNSGFTYRGPDAERAVAWVRSRVDRAVAEIGVTQRNQPERQAVTDKLWQYAVEERGETA